MSDIEVAGLTAAVETLAGEVATEREERKRENLKRDERIKWSRRAIALALFVGLVGIAVGFIGWRANSDRISDNRHTICVTTETFANSLISLSVPASTKEQHDLQQSRIDAFEADLEHRSGCDLNLLDAPAIQGG